MVVVVSVVIFILQLDGNPLLPCLSLYPIGQHLSSASAGFYE
jgi:hypothetical protein